MKRKVTKNEQKVKGQCTKNLNIKTTLPPQKKIYIRSFATDLVTLLWTVDLTWPPQPVYLPLTLLGLGGRHFRNVIGCRTSDFSPVLYLHTLWIYIYTLPYNYVRIHIYIIGIQGVLELQRGSGLTGWLQLEDCLYINKGNIGANNTFTFHFQARHLAPGCYNYVLRKKLIHIVRNLFS